MVADIATVQIIQSDHDPSLTLETLAPALTDTCYLDGCLCCRISSPAQIHSQVFLLSSPYASSFSFTRIHLSSINLTCSSSYPSSSGVEPGTTEERVRVVVGAVEEGARVVVVMARGGVV